MTIENELYGGGWQTCAKCGVKDRPDQLVKIGGDVVHNTEKKDPRPCAEWKASLSKAKPADIKQALEQLTASPAADQVLAEVHAPIEPFKTVTTFAYPPHDKGGK